MASDNNDNKHYSAEDISRYWQGQMSAQEMHELEAAAMDDPFLADALEGYSTADPKNVSADINELRERLAEKASDTRVVPLKRNKWWRVAAVLIFLGGAAALTYSLLMNDNASQKNMVQLNKTDAPTITQTEGTAPVKQSDTITGTTQQGSATRMNVYDSASAGNADIQESFAQSEKEMKANDNKYLSPSTPLNKEKKDLSGGFNSSPVETKSVPDLSAYRKKDSLPIPDWAVDDDFKTTDSISAAATNADRDRVNRALQNNVPRDQPERREVNMQRNANSQFNINNFSGRVVDPHNNAIPFASVRVNNNNQIAAANNDGVFQFRSADSIVDVSVTSVGYQSRQLTIRGNSPVQEVILEPQNAKMSEVVVTKSSLPVKKKSVSQSELKVYVMDAQPVIGWEEYNNYLEKNQRIDSTYKSIKGEVVVSFMVGKTGQLSSFNIDKSLGKFQDAEAIRLIKEGPAWRVLKGKKTRARVIVKF